MNKIIIKNITLISMDNTRDTIEKEIDIKIEAGKISKIGENLDSTGFEIIDGTNKILLPGFINTHTHLPMVLFRDSINGLRLEQWLEDFIWPIENELTPEEIYYATLLSCLEMIENGVTTVNDHYFYCEQIIKAANEVGIDLILSRCLLDNDNNGEKRLKEALELLEKYPSVKFTIGIHGLYTNSEEYIKKITFLAKQKNMPVHMHFCETDTEVKTIKERYGVNHPSEVLEKYFKDLKCVLAHGVKLDEYDLDVISKMNISISHCPVSNLRLGCGIADLTRMQELGINISLGTDGQGSGNNTNMLETMRLTALLQKGIKEDPLLMDAYEVLKMATVNGAKALGLEKEIGSIEVGKRANMIIFDFKGASTFPINNYISDIVYNASSSDIAMVLVDGQIVKDSAKYNINKQDIINKCQGIVDKVFKRGEV